MEKGLITSTPESTKEEPVETETEAEAKAKESEEKKPAKASGVNRILGRMEIAYNQFWVNRHEKKAVQLKNKIDGSDLKIRALEQSKQEIALAIGDLKAQNIPGSETLKLKIKAIDQEITGFSNTRDAVQSKLEERENKAKLYTNKRDRVADKLIGHYDEKLEPMEEELENLQTCKDQVDLVMAVTEAKHGEQLEKLNNIKKRKTQLENALRTTGMSEKQVQKFEAVKALTDLLVQGREKVRLEWDDLMQRKARINEKIADVDAKANPYRDKREKFARVKAGRPVSMEVATRQRVSEFKGTEEATSHTRTESSEEKPSGVYETSPMEAKVAESIEKDKERRTASDYISGWNTYLQKKYGGDLLATETVNSKDFLSSTRLSSDYKLDFKDFKNILTRYYKLKKMPADKLNADIDKFFADTIKVQK
ncbi:MAG TPA: hypothetical protein VLK22_03795 [Candidatus Udaeobacter sp.]|nr:hypothetical protein [Candidatus Udaeobacter sp.]